MMQSKFRLGKFFVSRVRVITLVGIVDGEVGRCELSGKLRVALLTFLLILTW